MTVKSVLTLSAANLGREDLVSAVCDCDEAPAGEVSALLRCYNLVENEIALDYFPLRAEQKFERAGGVLPFSRFERAPVDVISVIGEEGNRVPFEIRPAYLHLKLAPGEERNIVVSYNYAPEEKSFTDDCEVNKNISARLLSFGVVSEFLLSHGQFAEAATWEKKFREALRAAATQKRPILIRSRRWA